VRAARASASSRLSEASLTDSREAGAVAWRRNRSAHRSCSATNSSRHRCDSGSLVVLAAEAKDVAASAWCDAAEDNISRL
jgi:hypothetical protein